MIRKKSSKRPRLKARKPIPKKNVKRAAKNFARAYGSKERVEWVNAQRCVSCLGTQYPRQNHHVITGGTGRKSDYRHVVGLCWHCHSYVHSMGELPYRRPLSDLIPIAERTEIKWQLYAKQRGLVG